MRVLLGGLLLVAGADRAVAGPPIGVSPGRVEGAPTPASSCPTFSWSAAEGASGYELVVYRASPPLEPGAPSEPLLRQAIAGRALSWSPPVDRCLAGDATYAWSVRALGSEAEGSWSAALLFEVRGAPSQAEVARALAVLERYVEAGASDLADPTPPQARPASPEPTPVDAGHKALRSPTLGASPGAAPPLPPPDYALTIDQDLGLGGSVFKGGQRLLHTEGDQDERNTALGLNALTNLVADYASFYGYDNTAVGYAALENLEFGTSNTGVGHGALRQTIGSFNTAVGDRALGNATSGNNTAVGAGAMADFVTGINNAAVGMRALQGNTTGSNNVGVGANVLLVNGEGAGNVAVGAGSLLSLNSGDANVAVGYRAMSESEISRYNVAVGHRALEAATDAYANVAVGYRALYQGTTAGSNVALGRFALRDTTSGGGNVAIGPSAGALNTTGSDNVFIDNTGQAGDGTTTSNNVIRIGNNQELTFIDGIRGTTTQVADAVGVVIDSAGQLGTTSSSRTVKRDIRAIGGLSRRLLALQPVAFRYREHVEQDPETSLQFGLLAEDVAGVFPELVVFDRAGRPQTVKYHLLSSLLLNEVQRQQGRLRIHALLISITLVVALAVALDRWRQAGLAGESR